MKASPVSESLYPIYKNLQNFALIQTSQKLSQKCFILEKFLYENEPKEPKNLKKMLRNLRPQMTELQFLKTLILRRGL